MKTHFQLKYFGLNFYINCCIENGKTDKVNNERKFDYNFFLVGIRSFELSRLPLPPPKNIHFNLFLWAYLCFEMWLEKISFVLSFFIIGKNHYKWGTRILNCVVKIQRSLFFFISPISHVLTPSFISWWLWSVTFQQLNKLNACLRQNVGSMCYLTSISTYYIII